MKKFTLLTILLAGFIGSASAQLLPSFQFGIKGGLNLSSISTSSTISNLDGDHRAGYLAGFWARVGGAGFHFQPEAYVTSKNVTLHNSAGAENEAKFTSIDVPLLFGTRAGALGIGARFDTGPLVSFAVNKDQSFSNAAARAYDLNYKDQNYAWQFGAALDVRKVSFDLRYELGLNKVTAADGSKTHINLFNFTIAYRLFGI